MLQHLNQHRSHGPIFDFYLTRSFTTLGIHSKISIVTDQLRSTREGNVFTSVFDSVHRGGEWAPVSPPLPRILFLPYTSPGEVGKGQALFLALPRSLL